MRSARSRSRLLALLFLALMVWSLPGALAQPPEDTEEVSEWWEPPRDELEPDVSIKWNGSSGATNEGSRTKFVFKVTDQGPLFYHSGVDMVTFSIKFRGKTWSVNKTRVVRNWMTIENPVTGSYTVSQYVVRWAHTMRPVTRTCKKLVQVSVSDHAGNKASVSRYVTIRNVQTGDGSAGESDDDTSGVWHNGLTREGDFYWVRVRYTQERGQFKAADQWSYGANQGKLNAEEYGSDRWWALATCIYFYWYAETPNGKDPEVYYVGRWSHVKDGRSGWEESLGGDKSNAGGDFGGYYADGGTGP